jgi:hypothetical protein
MISEYRRTCNVCGKRWHSLVTREAEIIQRKQANAAQGLVGCCSPNTSATSIGTGQIIDSELQRLRQCPECQSVNFDEEIVDYEGKASDVAIPVVASPKQTSEESVVESDSGATNTEVPPKFRWGCGSVAAVIVGAIIVVWWVTWLVSSLSATDESVTEFPTAEVPAITVPSDCLSAVAAAADVPGDRSNNAEVKVAASTCTNVDDFVEALKLFPFAAGQTVFVDSDVQIFIPIVCYQFPDTKVCLDAAVRGLLD